MDATKTSINLLPDDAILAIGGWVAATGVKNFARCLKVNRRLRSVLKRTSVVQDIIEQATQNSAPGIESLYHLALWEEAHEVGLWEENRIGFGYGSTAIAQNSPWSRNDRDEDILDSQRRMADMASILNSFPEAFVRIEAHCGTAAPAGIAERFSLARGRSVVHRFLELLAEQWQDEDENVYHQPHDLAVAEQRLHLTAWGTRISEVAENSTHRYRSVARQGKGWVELYLCCGDSLEMPPRPDYYNGELRQADDESDDGMFLYVHAAELETEGDDSDSELEEMDDEEAENPEEID